LGAFLFQEDPCLLETAKGNLREILLTVKMDGMGKAGNQHAQNVCAESSEVLHQAPCCAVYADSYLSQITFQSGAAGQQMTAAGSLHGMMMHLLLRQRSVHLARCCEMR